MILISNRLHLGTARVLLKICVEPPTSGELISMMVKSILFGIFSAYAPNIIVNGKNTPDAAKLLEI